MDTAKTAGFFSLWLTVYRQFIAAFNGDDCGVKFLSLVNNNNFKATNKAKLP